MHGQRRWSALAAVAILIGLSGGCSDSGGGTGRLSVGLTDAPAGVAALWVTVVDVRVKACGGDDAECPTDGCEWPAECEWEAGCEPPEGCTGPGGCFLPDGCEWPEACVWPAECTCDDSAGGWVDLTVEPITLDLLTLADGGLELLNGEQGDLLDAGDYCEVRLVLGEETRVELTDGSSQVLKVPSGSSSGYKIKGEFRVDPDALTILVLDLDADRSLHLAGNSGKYVLQPVVEIADVRYEPLPEEQPADVVEGD